MMTALFYCRVLIFVSLLLGLSGCGYNFTSSSAKTHALGQLLWVPFIGNESVSPTAQTVIRRALYEECHALRGLEPSQSESTAELIMKGRLLSFSSGALTYNALDQVRSLRLTLVVELELHRKGDPAPLWKGVLDASKDYQAGPNLAMQRNAEDAALDAAARIIAQKFISSTEQSY